MPLQVPVTQTGLEASIQQAMKNAGRNAQINLGTNSRQINALAQPLGRITGKADEFTRSMEAANARVFAFGASVGIINGVTKAFSSLVKNTIEVEKSLVEINTVLNTSGDSLQKFGNKLFDVAKTTGQTFDVVAKGALELARQGLSTEETLKRINDALILSRLSGLDAQQSVEGLTAAFNSFKETGITTSQILNKLVVVSQKYSVSERDLIEGLKRSASVADQAGVSFDELVGIITTVQERTARGGAVIGNAFKTIFARIQDTGALQDLANLGIQITDLEGKVLPATRILQNLGAEFNNLSQLEQADIAKKLGGVYQLSNLLAAVKDLSSEQSKYNDIVKLSAGATNEAYQKNAALNETLAALINKVSVSAQQLGATLGAIGITDNLKQLLDFFNNILEGIQKILGEESAMGTFVRGLAKGIGNVLAGPGLILFGAIIAKLSKDLIAFGVESLKSFFKIGQSAKEIASVEKAIAAALGSNLTLQKQLFALEGNRAAQIKLMTDAIVQQEAVMRRMASTAGSLAGPLYQQGVRSTGGQGLRVPKAAGGYMPAVSQESRDISRGVGGARSGDKPVVIPNFAFGGGKKGTMVAHTGEYIVPNFAAGGSAIFNRDMVRSMGLPAGAKKIGAAGGFIPNFAEWYNRDTTKVKTSNSMPTTPGDWVKVKSNSESIRKYSENIDQYRVRDTDFYLFPDGTGSRGNAVRATLGREVSKGTINKQKAQAKEEKFGSFTLDANQLGGILVVSPRFGAEGVGSLDTKLQAHEIPLFNYDSAPPIDKNKFIKLNNLKTSNTPKPQNVQGLQGDISQLFAGGIVDLAYRLYGGTFDPASAGEFSQKLKSLDPSKKEQLIPPAAQGSLFEAAGKVALNSFSNLESLFGSGEENRPFDFQNATAMQKMFGVSVGRGEAKRGDEKNFTTSKQITGIVKKVFNDPEYSSRALDALEKQGAFSPEMQRKKNNEEVSNAINGFVPNFASYPYKLSTIAPTKEEGQRSYLKWEKWSQLSNEEKKNTPYKSSVINNPYAIRQFNQGLRLNPNIEKDDRVDSIGFRVTKVPILNEKLKQEIVNKTNSKQAGARFEKLAIRFLKYEDGAKFLYNKDKSAVDGFRFAGNKNIDLLEVKAGEWNASEVQNKFARFVPENVNLSGPSLIKEKINQLFTEGVPREQDTIKLNNTLAIPDIEGYTGKIKAGGKADPNKKQKDFYDAFSVSQLSQAQNAKLKKGAGGYIPNFVSQKYVMDTLARIKAGTSGFSKQEQETFLNKFGAKSTGRKISLREVYDKLDGDVGISALIDKAYMAAGPTASNEDVYRIFEKQIKANPYALRGLVSKKGFVPNFADPLKEAIGRGAASGFVPNYAYEDDNIPSYVRQEMEKSPSFKRIKSLYDENPNISYLSRGAESFAFKNNGEVLKVPTFQYADKKRLKDKIGGINDMNWSEASDQLSFLAPNLKIIPPKTSGVIISQSFAGETVGNVIEDFKKAHLIGTKASQVFDSSKRLNPRKPNWLKPLSVDNGSSHNFTFPENLSQAKKDYFNNPKTSAEEIFNRNKIGLIDLGVFRYYSKQAREEEKKITQGGVKAGGLIPNFAVDLTKSQDYIENQRKRNFKAGTYRKATGAIGSLFKSLPEKFFADGVLGDGAQGLETNGIFNLIKQNALYGASFAGPKAVKFVTEAEKYGLKVEKSLKDKLAKLVVKGASKIKGYSGGFLPNFADPLKEAIGREMSAGVPASQIYVDQNSSLKNSMNPMGLMVANRRDEPGGGMQGVSRARKEGANPMMYGAADGFIPNYAVSKIGEVTKNNSNLAFGTSNQQIASFNKGLENITVGLRNGSIKFNEAMSQVSKLASATGQNTTQVKKLESAGKSLMGAYNSELTIRNQKAQELKKQRVNSSMGPAAVGTAGSKAPRDLLGTVFAVQAGLSLLTGATEGATSELGKYTNIVSGGIGTATSTLFAFQGLSAALPKFAGFLGPAGIAVSAATAAFQIGKDIMLELSGANKGAAQNSALLAKAAQSAATRLDELNPVTQAKVKQSAKDIQYNLEKGLFTKKGEYIEPPVAKNRGESLTPEFQKKIKEYRVKIGEDLSPEDINKYREKFEKAKKEAEKIGKPVAKNRAEASSPEFQKKLMEYRKATDKKSYYEDALTKARESGGTVKVKLAGVSPDDEKNYQDALLNARASGLGASTIAKTVLDEAKKTNGKEEGELYTDNIEEIIKKLGELSKNPDFKRIKQDIDDIFSFEDLSFAPIDDIFKGIAVKIKDGSLGAKEQEDLIQNLTKTIGNREVAEDLVVGAIERGKKALEDKNNAQAQANAGISKQVKETLKLLKVQQSIDARKRGEAAVSKSAELANLQQSLAISSDLSLSETQRATASAKLETAYSRVTKELEAAAQIGDELDNVIKNFSDESEKITTNLQPDQIKNGIEKAKVAMDSFGKSADEAKLIANAIAEGGIKGGAAYEKLAGVIKEKLSPEFAAIPEAVDLAVQGTLNLNSAREKILTTLNDEIYSMQRLADLNLKVKQIEEDRKNIVEKVNYNLEGRASALSYQASQISNTTSLNQAKKELETTIYQRTATTTSPESYKQGLDEINKKYFDLEQAATLRKAEIEAKADLIRNNKVDENSIKIGYNTTAINDFYTLLKNDIKTLLQQMPGNIKTAIEQAEPQQSQSNTASTNSTSSPALNQGNQTIPYLLRRPQETSSTGSVEAAANNIRNIEIPTLNVNQAISQSTIQQTGYIDKQASIAKTLSSLSIEEINSGALTAAKDLAVQYGKSNTEVTQIAEGIKTMAITLKEAKDSFNLENETQQINDAVEELNKMPKGFASTFSESIRTMKTETAFFQDRLGETIPTLFADNLAQGIEDAVTGAKSLEDALLDAASSFVSEIQSMAIKNLANTFTSSIFGFSSGGEVKKYASGGMINGGSGSKDDVPAMLMGGEYVIKKKAVEKYGPEFLNAINNGSIKGYASGGTVTSDEDKYYGIYNNQFSSSLQKAYSSSDNIPNQTGVGGFYTPGTYGKGSIMGRNNLLSFATQSGTSGQYDRIISGENYASIDLEPESIRLTNYGRTNSAQAQSIQAAKEQAFDLYLEDMDLWEDYYEALEEAREEEKARKKAFWTSLATAAVTSVASSALSSAGQGFKAGWSNAASQTSSTFSSKLSGGMSGAIGGATVDGVKVGGLSNWFSGVGSALTGNFKQAGNYFNLSQISSSEGLQKAYASSIQNKSSFSPFLENQGYIPKATVVNETNSMQQAMGSNGIINWNKKAVGGAIPSTSGVDTIPTMLSGGEFIMNRAASQNIGTGNLQALNGGANSLPTEEKTEELNDKLVSKLDELIVVMTEGGGGSGSITINVGSSNKSTEEISGESSTSDQQLARKIKDTVIQVIEQEKRLGGKLRKGL